MDATVQMWIVSGVCGATILLLGAIWSEIRQLNSNMHEMMMTTTRQSTRLDTIEKLIDKLPCLNNLICPSSREKS